MVLHIHLADYPVKEVVHLPVCSCTKLFVARELVGQPQLACPETSGPFHILRGLGIPIALRMGVLVSMGKTGQA